MENASKALLIAGAILIVILLIGVGMMIYQGALGGIDQAIARMSQQEKQMYNQQFSDYEGTNKKGTQIKALIEAVASNNVQNNETPEKSVGLDLSAANIKDITVNKWEYKDLATDETAAQMSAARARVNSNALFTVVTEMDTKTGLIKNIKVTAGSGANK